MNSAHIISTMERIDGAAERMSPTLTFAEVYAHADFVARVVALCGVPDAEVADAVQDVFVVVHRKLKAYEHRGRLCGWLRRISAHIAARHRHAARRRPGVGLFANAADTAADDVPALDLEARELLLHLLGAVDAQPRAVLLLDVEGFSRGEIAKALGVRPGTVSTRLRRARAAIRGTRRRYEARAAFLPTPWGPRRLM